MNEIRITIPEQPPSLNHVATGRPMRTTVFYYADGRPAFSVDNGCWIWTAYKDRAGYGVCIFKEERMAHRHAFREAGGQIPEGFTIDHLCRRRACINPAHLEAVTLKENVRRSPRTKLRHDQVSEIRSGSESPTSLAKRFGVTIQAICRVRKGLSWKD